MDESTDFVHQNSEVLVRHARSGNELAWREILRRYHRMLVVQVQSRIPGYARRRFDEEDVLQRAFTKAFVHLGGFVYGGEGSFRRWLGKLVVHEFANELKKQPIEHLRSAPETQTVSGTLDEKGHEGVLLAEDSSALYEKLGVLDEVDRDVLSAYYFEKKSLEEIGNIQQCSRDTAKQLVQVAMQRLQRELRA